MITNINEILVEWAYRTRDGLPDPKSMSHQIILEGILREFGWNIEQRGELLRNLQEAPKKSAEDEKYFGIGPNSYILKKDKPKDYKKGDKLPGIQKFSKDKDSGEYSPVGEKPEDDKDGKDKAGDITAEPDAFDRFADKDKKTQKKAKDTQKQKAAGKKKKDETAHKEKSSEVRSEIYGHDGIEQKKGTLIGDGDTPSDQSDREIKQLCLEHGYKDFEKNAKGADGKPKGKPAPGNAGSMFNEIISGEGNSILDRYPDLTEEELARVLYDQFCGTKLGNEVKSNSLDTGVGAGDIPSDVEGKDKGCYSKCLVTARSAKRKKQRAQESVDAVRDSGADFEEPTKTHSYYGHEDSLKAQVAMIKKALSEGKKVYAPDGTEITSFMTEEKLYALILGGGKGDNPSDTATFVEDKNGNLILMFTSDKMTTADQQANSTLINEINNRKKTIEGLGLSDDDTKKATDEVDRHKKEVSREQSKLKKITPSVGEAMAEEVDNADDPDAKVEEFIDAWENDKERVKHWNKFLDSVEGLSDPPSDADKKCAAKLFMEVVAGEKARPVGPDVKDAKGRELEDGQAEHYTLGPDYKAKSPDGSVSCSKKGWMNDSNAKLAARTAAAKVSEGNDDKRYNIKKEIEDIRKNIIRMERNHLVELNKIKVSVDGVEKGLGELIEGQQISDQLHLKMMDEDENHPMMSHGLFEVNAGGHPINKEVLQKCLAEGKEDFTSKDFIKGFKVMASDVDEPGDRYTWNCSLATGQKPPEFDDKGEVIDSGICKDGTPRRATGRVMFIYAVTSEGKLIKVAQKNMRTKTGDLGKYDTTVTYHKEMQECIEKGL